MRLVFETRVAQPPAQVIEGFNRALFDALSPPFPRVHVARFDGSKTGDEVHLELNFLLFRQRWVSVIVEDCANDEEVYFVDEGSELPFFLGYWRHRHRILRDGSGSRIVDDITYRGPNALLSVLLYPGMWLQFAYRKPVYRRVFGRA